MRMISDEQYDDITRPYKKVGVVGTIIGFSTALISCFIYSNRIHNLQDSISLKNKDMIENSTPIKKITTVFEVNENDTTISTKIDTISWIVPNKFMPK